MSLGSILNTGTVTFPSRDPNNYAQQYKRRVYGSVTCTGNDQYSCGGGSTLSFQSLADPTKQRGGRYAPAPHLTSITTKNVGGGDLSDAALWEIEFQWIAYSKGQLDSLAPSFMIPGNNINVSFGWNTGGSVSISGARIYDFSWSYSIDDGSYSCTGKAIGQVAGAMGGLVIKTSAGSTINSAGGEVKNYSIMSEVDGAALGAFNAKRDKSGKLTGTNIPGRDGGAQISSDGKFGVANILVELGTFMDDRMYVTYTRLGKVIEFINNNLSDKSYRYRFVGGGGASGGTFKPIDIRSADPAKMLFCGQYASYATDEQEDHNNFSKLTGPHGVTSDIWVSTQLLIDIENSVMDKRSDGEPATFSSGKFLSKLFGEISNLSGGLVDLIVVPEDDKKLTIVNRHYEIKKSGGSTLHVRSLTSPVKSVSMSSTLDPDMAAIAFSGGAGKFPKGMADKIFAGCTSKISDANTGPSLVEKIGEKLYQLGLAYNESQVADLKKILREYVMEQLEGSGISIRYTIDLSLTCDGFDPKFGQTFKVDIVPNSIGSAGAVSFMVGEIEHKVDGATWETGITGFMMVNA